MDDRATLPEINHAYVLGKEDGHASGYYLGFNAGIKRNRRMITGLAWLCVIELGFLIAVLLH